VQDSSFSEEKEAKRLLIHFRSMTLGWAVTVATLAAPLLALPVARFGCFTVLP
jgi:hypothetical protein